MKDIIGKNLEPAALMSMVSGFLLMAAANASVWAQVPVEDAGELQETEEAVTSEVPDTETHASREADQELLQIAAQQPERFIGKPVHFSNGEEIGLVLDVRRNRVNLKLYLVVDAWKFFNDEVVYAVPAADVTELGSERVLVAMNPGMHLPGKEYFADEYTAPSENFVETALEE